LQYRRRWYVGKSEFFFSETQPHQQKRFPPPLQLERNLATLLIELPPVRKYLSLISDNSRDNLPVGPFPVEIKACISTEVLNSITCVVL